MAATAGPTHSTVEALRRRYGACVPTRAFTGTSHEDFIAWMAPNVARLEQIFRLAREPAAEPVRVIRSVQRDGYREDHLSLTAPDGVRLPARLRVPRGQGPFPAIVFLHGHGASIEHVTGEAEAPPGSTSNTRAYLSSLRWVDAAARAGFLCLIPEHRGFGALTEPTRPDCTHAFLNALALGQTLQGMRIADLMLWIASLARRDDLQPHRLAVGGISLGGELAVLVAIFDPRVDAVITAGYVRLLREQLPLQAFCPCSYAPDLYREFDLPELAGLLAPRALLIQTGDRDPLCPRDLVERASERTREIYRAAGGQLDVAFFPGLHEFDGAGALRWLRERWIADPSPS